VASSMTPFDSLLFCKLGIPFLGVCYSCNKSRACNHLAFLDGGLASPPFVGPLVSIEFRNLNSIRYKLHAMQFKYLNLNET
jgi:hypothetical protein